MTCNCTAFLRTEDTISGHISSCYMRVGDVTLFFPATSDGAIIVRRLAACALKLAVEMEQIYHNTTPTTSELAEQLVGDSEIPDASDAVASDDEATERSEDEVEREAEEQEVESEDDGGAVVPLTAEEVAKLAEEEQAEEELA